MQTEVFLGLAALGAGTASLWAAPVSVFEADGHLRVVAMLPGLSKHEIQVDLAGNVLTIRGAREPGVPAGAWESLPAKWSAGFVRSIPLPFSPDPNSLKAIFADGMLVVSMPQPDGAEAQSRRVPVTGDSALGPATPGGPGAPGDAARPAARPDRLGLSIEEALEQLAAGEAEAPRLAPMQRVVALRRELRALRESRRLGQEEVARRMGVPQSVVSRLENHLNPKTELGTVLRYLHACGADLVLAPAAGDSAG